MSALWKFSSCDQRQEWIHERRQVSQLLESSNKSFNEKFFAIVPLKSLHRNWNRKRADHKKFFLFGFIDELKIPI